jgi:Lar family restriction alleviation protein
MNLDPKALKPCPFCGLGGDELDTVHEPDRPLPFYVYCDGCGARTGYHFTVQSAIAAWNRRSASVPADVAGLERLIAQLRNHLLVPVSLRPLHDEVADALSAQAAALEAKDKALEPFAEVADSFDADGRDLPDDCPIYANKAGDFRAARRARTIGRRA